MLPNSGRPEFGIKRCDRAGIPRLQRGYPVNANRSLDPLSTDAEAFRAGGDDCREAVASAQLERVLHPE